ncbi:MAG: hypothetical protein D6729_12070, partial [Deltaproteobacteria bacterium]
HVSFLRAEGGSGGFARIAGEGGLVEYQAGDLDGDRKDLLVVSDAAGDSVTIEVQIGPALVVAPKREILDPETETVVDAEGGKPPYLFGALALPSGGTVDTLTGRYRAGPVGCVTDRVVVRDSVGTERSAEVQVACPRDPFAPDDDIFGVITVDIDGNGLDERVYLVRSGLGADVVVPTFGGLTMRIPITDATDQRVNGTPVAFAAVRNLRFGWPPARAVVAMDTAGSMGAPSVKVFEVSLLFAPSYVQQLDLSPLDALDGIPIIVGNESAPGTAVTGYYIAYQSALDGLWKAIDVDPVAGTVQQDLAEANKYAVVMTPAGRGAFSDPACLYVSATGWQYDSLVGGAAGLQVGGPVPPVGLNSLQAAVGVHQPSASGVGVALLGSGAGGSDSLVLLDVGPVGSPLQEAARIDLPAGQSPHMHLSALDLGGNEDLLVVTDLDGAMWIAGRRSKAAAPAPWSVGTRAERVFAGDIDFDGLGELLVTGRGEVRVVDLEVADGWDRGSPIVAPSGSTLSGELVQVAQVPWLARFADGVAMIDTGLLADGTPAPDLPPQGLKSGGLVLARYDGLLSPEPEPVPLGSAEERVLFYAVARLHAPLSPEDPDPADVVAVLGPAAEPEGGPVRIVARLARGLGALEAPVEVPLPPGTMAVDWLQAVPMLEGEREAVLAGLRTQNGSEVRALAWDPASKGLVWSKVPVALDWLGPPPVVSQPGAPLRWVVVPDGRAGTGLVQLAVDGAGEVQADLPGLALTPESLLAPPFAVVQDAAASPRLFLGFDLQGLVAVDATGKNLGELACTLGGLTATDLALWPWGADGDAYEVAVLDADAGRLVRLGLRFEPGTAGLLLGVVGGVPAPEGAREVAAVSPSSRRPFRSLLAGGELLTPWVVRQGFPVPPVASSDRCF